MVNNFIINIKENMFFNEPIILIENNDFKVTLFKYKSGTCGVNISNNLIEFDLLPYAGYQLWNFKFKGKNLTQKSIFEYPLDNKKFGDNYGGFMYHCGLSNINCADDGEDYPLHGEIPFAKFENNFIKIEDGSISICGTWIYRNSQDYYYSYKPVLNISKNSSLINMKTSIKNLRRNTLNYLSMVHMNWLVVEGSKLYYSANKDDIYAEKIDSWDNSERVNKLSDFSKVVNKSPYITDEIDKKTRLFNPEYCINIKYKGDENNMAHSLMQLPSGESYYVSFDNSLLPYGLRWFCRTGDEDGIGFCCPTTGDNHSTKHQIKHGYYNSLDFNQEHELSYVFGVLDKDSSEKMKDKIISIVRSK